MVHPGFKQGEFHFDCAPWILKDKISTSILPGPTEYRKLPKTTENNRKLPKTTEYYRKLIYPKYRKQSKLPKTTPDWFLLMLE